MSGPLSLREARTKRQKAKVYKTSRSEFRSTLNSALNDDSSEQEGTDQGDGKMTRRKIMKVNEKGMGEQAKAGEIGGNEEVPKTEEKDSDNRTAEDGEDKTVDDEKKDEDEASGSKDKKDKKDEKKDDDSDENGGNHDFNVKDGEKDSDKGSDENRNDLGDIDGSSTDKGGEGGSGNRNSDKGVDEKYCQEKNENTEEIGDSEKTENQETQKREDPNLDFGYAPFEDDDEELLYHENEYYEHWSEAEENVSDAGVPGHIFLGSDDDDDEIRNTG